MHYRELTSDDAAAIALLWHAGAEENARHDPAFRPRRPAAAYAQTVSDDLAQARMFGWGAFDGTGTGATLHGYLTAEFHDASADWQMGRILYVLDVDVASASRRRGIARALLDLARRKAIAEGITRVELSWLAADPRSAQVWARLGFRAYLSRGYLDVDRH